MFQKNQLILMTYDHAKRCMFKWRDVFTVPRLCWPFSLQQLQLLPLVGFVIKFSSVLPIVRNCPATPDYRLGRLPEKA